MSDKSPPLAGVIPNRKRIGLPDYAPGRCPRCGATTVEGYGLAGGGLGAYTFCERCGSVVTKSDGRTKVHEPPDMICGVVWSRDVPDSDLSPHSMAWIKDQSADAHACGLHHQRVTYLASGRRMLFEAWSIRPEDEGPPRWHVLAAQVVCGHCGSADIISYASRDTAICPKCCLLVHGGHDYERDGGEWYCRYCGDPPDVNWLADRADG